MASPERSAASRLWCREILSGVSRTFALNIRLLSGDLRDAVTCGYLVCRILDTVEDEAGWTAERKRDLLLGFLPLLDAGTRTDEGLALWVERAADSGTPAERLLVANTRTVLDAYDSLPEAMRGALAPPVRRMAEGMATMLLRHDGEEPAWIADDAELDEYCYYVAGTVGEMLTALFEPLVPSRRHEALRFRQVAFGLGLQMTNILKDWRTDRGRGWCYLPKRRFVEAGLDRDALFRKSLAPEAKALLRDLLTRSAGNLREALAYTLTLPRRRLRLRWFCAVPLLLAAETLVHLRRNVDDGGVSTKISRSAAKSLVRSVLLLSTSNAWLRGSVESRLRIVESPA